MFYLAAAFIAVWLAVTLYVIYLSRRQRELEDELKSLQETAAPCPRNANSGQARKRASHDTGCTTADPRRSTGNPAPPATTEPAGRLQVFLHAVAFVLGFGAVFTLLGSAAGLLGRSLNEFLPVIQRLGAILLIVFGLITIGVFSRLSAFIRQRTDLAHNPAARAWSAFSTSSPRCSIPKSASARCTTSIAAGATGAALCSASASAPAGCPASARSSPASSSWRAIAPQPGRERCCSASTASAWASPSCLQGHVQHGDARTAPP